MILTCPHCSKEHIVNPEKLPAHIRVVRCKFCQMEFPLRKSAPPTEPEPVAQVRAANNHPLPKVRMRKIAVTLSKGGVGKTTTAVNLAVGLARAGNSVLLVDTDTQGQSAFMLGVKPDKGLTELLTGKTSPWEALCQARDNLWLLAGGKSLAGIKRIIDRKDFGGEQTLAEALAIFEGKFDYVIVDTSPGWDPITVNVLFYVDELLAPVSLEVMTLQGLVSFLKSIASIQKYRNVIRLQYIVPTFMDKRVKKSAAILKKLHEIYGDKVCTPIRYNVAVAETPAYGQSIFEFASKSHGACDYQELVERIRKDSIPLNATSPGGAESVNAA